MGYYAVPGNQATIAATYKTAALVQTVTSGTARRIKVYEIMVGASANPNATDTYIQWDVSRITASGAGAYTSWTPTLLDPADIAASTLAGINATAEATAITANSSLWNEGVNQRGSLRWVAAQESQYLIVPGALNNGLILRGLSTTYASSVTGQLTFQE
jgi:hypothetical protein